jgi:hypothetical protein
MTLLEWIESHLKDQQISATRFGRQAVGDPRFVLDLRNGRKPRRKTVARLEAYLAEQGYGDPVAGSVDAQVRDLPCAVAGSVGGKGDSILAPHALHLRRAGQAARRGKAARVSVGEGDRR